MFLYFPVLQIIQQRKASITLLKQNASLFEGLMKQTIRAFNSWIWFLNTNTVLNITVQIQHYVQVPGWSGSCLLGGKMLKNCLYKSYKKNYTIKCTRSVRRTLEQWLEYIEKELMASRPHVRGLLCRTSKLSNQRKSSRKDKCPTFQKIIAMLRITHASWTQATHV